ncbi:MAG: HEAT repeat domain-containing protein [Fimbriimonadaceae bacterium]|nr:HEAT repeat domain-containing protein [Fimbriimonadaceae bacterium]
MTDQQEVPIDQVRLRTAEDLLVALRSSNLQTRAAVLAAVMQAPDKAVAFGSYQGVDLIDELVDQLFRSEVPVYRHLVASALSVLDDPRVPPAMRRILGYYGEPDLVRVAADRLSREPVLDGLPVYRALAMQTDSMLHAQIGADLLINASELDDKTAIRVSVSNSKGVSVAPEVSATNLRFWIDELNGPYLRAATLLLEDQGLSTYRMLADNWSSLGEEAQCWLLRWGARAFPLESVGLLRHAVRSEYDSVVLESLRGIESLGSAKSLFSDELVPLLSHTSGSVRTLALSVGTRVDDVRGALSQEAHPLVVAELLIRLRETEGPDAVDVLVEALGHEDYRVRVQALTELTALGTAVRERARQLAQSEVMDQRVAGTNLLLAMGEQEWLEQHLLG